MIPFIPRFFYKNLVKPVFFLFDAEFVHNNCSRFGKFLGKYSLTRTLTKILFSYQNQNLTKTVDGNKFPNPIGLSAGFDYNGNVAEILSSVGFGFHTVGTVTAKPYEGNKKPRLARLKKSQSLLVNKGFKSDGALEIAKRLDSMNLHNDVLGISVGSSNVPEVNTIDLAIEDYIFTFNVFKGKEYVKYFELNISCPNTAFPESFNKAENLKGLLDALSTLNFKQPLYIKMPNELTLEETNALMDLAITFPLVKGFIFSNLVKNRNNPAFDVGEIEKVKNMKGNFSGKPTHEGALKLVKNAKIKYGNKMTIIGCGGVFSPEDAQNMLGNGADLVQLITGMIFEGPQLIGEINKDLAMAKESVK